MSNTKTIELKERLETSKGKLENRARPVFHLEERKISFHFEHRHGQFLVKNLFGKIIKRVSIPDELTDDEKVSLSLVLHVYKNRQCPVGYDLVGLESHNFKTLWLRMLVKDVNETLYDCLKG